MTLYGLSEGPPVHYRQGQDTMTNTRITSACYYYRTLDTGPRRRVRS